MAANLTKREMEVATLVWKGFGARDIARELGMTWNTERRHMANIFEKTGMGTRVELALWVERNQREAVPAPQAAKLRVRGETASFHVKTVQTVHGTELQIDVVGQ